MGWTHDPQKTHRTHKRRTHKRTHKRQKGEHVRFRKFSGFLITSSSNPFCTQIFGSAMTNGKKYCLQGGTNWPFEREPGTAPSRRGRPARPGQGDGGNEAVCLHAQHARHGTRVCPAGPTPRHLQAPLLLPLHTGSMSTISPSRQRCSEQSPSGREIARAEKVCCSVCTHPRGPKNAALRKRPVAGLSTSDLGHGVR